LETWNITHLIIGNVDCNTVNYWIHEM